MSHQIPFGVCEDESGEPLDDEKGGTIPYVMKRGKLDFALFNFIVVLFGVINVLVIVTVVESMRPTAGSIEVILIT